MDVNKHPYIVTGRCPCKMDDNTVRRTMEVYNSLTDKSPENFAQELEKQKVIGKTVTYDKEQNTIFMEKKYGSECGEYNVSNKTKIGQRCYCSHYNGATEGNFPLSCCKCGAEFYRPMFAQIYGEDVLIEPYQTVLSGGESCILAVRIGKTEKDYKPKNK